MTRVLAVTSEIFPLIKTGGLADVTGALPNALAAHDVKATTLVPGYPAVLANLANATSALEIPDLFGGPARVLAGHNDTLNLFALDAPHLYQRPGNPYTGPDGADWPDNARRFAALASIAAWIARGAIAAYQPALVHGHDWQAGLTMAYLRYGGPAPPSVFTVHNLAFQGQFPAGVMPLLGLPDGAFALEGIAHHGQVSYLKAGLQLADRITTVSPNYAQEIQIDANGMGFDGLLRHRGAVLSGIVNGIDDAVWNPRTDSHIAATYTAKTPARRAMNKAALQARFGLTQDAKVPLFGVVSRLSWQKGLDLLLANLPALLGFDAQLVLLGSGEAALETGFMAAQATHPGRIGCVVGYDEPVAHQIQAGSDFILVPSRFEPCGLTQLYAQRYGAVPLVSSVGGLVDTVEDGITGLSFSPVSVEALADALNRAAALFRKPRQLAAIRRAGMAHDVSWREPAAEYAGLYRDLLSSHKA